MAGSPFPPIDQTTSVKVVERSPANLPQTTSVTIFTIGSGKVRVVDFGGEVTEAIQNQGNDAKLIYVPTTGSPVDMCAVLDIANKPVGTIISITGTLATAMKASSPYVEVPANRLAGHGMTLGPGEIKLSCAASNTGKIKWTLHYARVDRTGIVNATAIVTA